MITTTSKYVRCTLYSTVGNHVKFVISMADSKWPWSMRPVGAVVASTPPSSNPERKNFLEVDTKKAKQLDFSRICERRGSDGEEDDDDELPELEPVQ